MQNVVKYCEDAYPTGDKADVSSRAEGYIIDALDAIAGDVEKNARNLVGMLSLQADALGQLDAKLGHVKFQLSLVKATHATVELNKLRAPVSSAPLLPAVEMLDRPAVRRKAYASMPLATRFAKFDDMGHCLKKEAVTYVAPTLADRTCPSPCSAPWPPPRLGWALLRPPTRPRPSRPQWPRHPLEVALRRLHPSRWEGRPLPSVRRRRRRQFQLGGRRLLSARQRHRRHPFRQEPRHRHLRFLQEPRHLLRQ